MLLKRVFLHSLLAFAGLCHSAVLAEEASGPGQQDGPALIETITVTASRRERPIREVANSVSVIDAERIQETLSRDIKDLVRYTPWLSVSNDPSRFGAAGFNDSGYRSKPCRHRD